MFSFLFPLNEKVDDLAVRKHTEINAFCFTAKQIYPVIPFPPSGYCLLSKLILSALAHEPMLKVWFVNPHL